jgi:hypothetical protein
MDAETINSAKATAGPAKYLAFVAVQAAGFGLVVVNGAPIYRQMAVDFSKHKPVAGISWWEVASVILIQAAYWLRVWLKPALPQGGNALLAHVVAFVGRLSFILASSTFSIIFLVRFEELSMPLHRLLLLVALLFSVFCFTLELEQLGRALNGANEHSKPFPKPA